MVQKIKAGLNNVTAEALRNYIAILVTFCAGLLSLAVYFLVKIDNKVDVSYDFYQRQGEMNIRFHEKFNELYEQDRQMRDHDDKLDARISEISVRLWTHQLEEYQKIGRLETLISRYHTPSN